MLSLPDLPAYLKDTSYLGQLVGRYGNRIGGAAFELDGKTYKLTANNGPNTLHGGDVGFGKYVWKVLGAGGGKNSYVKLGHHSPAGINGFPGQPRRHRADQRLREHADAGLRGHHRRAHAHQLHLASVFHAVGRSGHAPSTSSGCMMAASHYLPVNESRVPTGEIAPVAGTPFDFRKPKSVRVPPPSSHPQIALTARLRSLLGARSRSAPRRRRAVFTRERRAHAR